AQARRRPGPTPWARRRRPLAIRPRPRRLRPCRRPTGEPHMTYDHLFTPFRLGPVELKNRVVLPPHGHVVSSLWGTEEEAERHIGYWAARTGAGWVDGVSAHVRNLVPPGFEPTGVGAQVPGHFRQPWFVD